MVLVLDFVYARSSSEQCLALTQDMYGQRGNQWFCCSFAGISQGRTRPSAEFHLTKACGTDIKRLCKTYALTISSTGLLRKRSRLAVHITIQKQGRGVRNVTLVFMSCFKQNYIQLDAVRYRTCVRKLENKTNFLSINTNTNANEM